MRERQTIAELLRDADGALDRRRFLKLAAAVGAGSLVPWRALGGWGESAASAQEIVQKAPMQMARFPEKTDLILLTDRPPQLETPLKYFQKDLTPNDAFFVRWHLAGIPTSVDLSTFRLELGGHVEKPLSFSVDELKQKFEPVSVISVAQCSGNSRAYFTPRVMGGQWGHGAVGNAKWTGVRLSDLLKAAGMKSGAVDVSFAGLDEPPLTETPKFVKSLDVAKAQEPHIIVAYAMNDADMPMLNGFPLRLIVPGWFATYWMKMLNRITVLDKKFSGFWMDKAYRIPKNAEGNEDPKDLAKETVPITRFTVRSILVKPEPAEKISAGEAYEVQGVAMDSGKGITRVEVSTDGGKTWGDAKLDAELGKYSWRRFRMDWKPTEKGSYRILSKATNAAGETQVQQLWNRSGYQRNVVEQVEVNVA
ncbi:MAG TPA: molybdopterin-dependent oxidoreductase [Tepidisphaeraceae bacterium]